MLSKTSAILFAMVAAAPLAYSQDMAGQMVIENVPVQKKTSIELNPLSAAISHVPGIGAVSGSVEGALGNGFAGFVELGYADFDIANNLAEEAEENTNEPMVRKGYGYSTAAGMRYYEDPIGDSMYGSVSVAYSEGKAAWQFKDNDIKSELYVVTPALTAGYRWAWQSGVLLRLGAGVGIPKTVGQNVSDAGRSADVEEGRTKIEDIQDLEAVAKVDFGLGYAF